MSVESPQFPNLDELESRLRMDLPAIRRARANTIDRRRKLTESFASFGSSDTRLVVFGSIARHEVPSGSDLDWIFLIDGQSLPEHKDQEREIERRLVDGDFIKPGASGVFGRMVGSHDLVHNIGGEDDLNSNTTRRILLLLESYPGRKCRSV